MSSKQTNDEALTVTHADEYPSQNLTLGDDDVTVGLVTAFSNGTGDSHGPVCDQHHILDPSTGKCRLCSGCSENAHVKRPCNASQDTVCECNRDFYWDGVKGQCKRCDLCPHGWGAMRSCSPHRNSACRKCLPGTYSSVLSATLACFPCTDCGSRRLVVQQCTQIQDTVCGDDIGDRLLPKRVVPRIQNSIRRSPGDEDFGYFEETEVDHTVWPIYTALLGALVLALLAYVVLKRWHCSTPGRSTALRRRSAPQSKSTSDSTSNFRDVCTTKRRVLEILLNEPRVDGRDWRGLAKELGYDHEQISALESRSRTRGSDNCAKRLLNDWARQEGEDATIVSLIGALRRLQHFDAVALLLSGHDHCCARLRTGDSNVTVPASKPVKGSKKPMYPSYGYSRGRPMGEMV